MFQVKYWGGERRLKHMSNALLLESYQKAVDLKLNAEFIQLLREEIARRAIKLPDSA